MRRRAGHVDVVMGTHNVHRAAELLPSPDTTGPVTEILDAAVLDDHAMFPSALPAVRETSYNAWVTIQIGCDNHCAFCIVPAVRGVEISRPFDEIVDEVQRARRRRRHRDHAARPERQQLRPRPAAGGPARRRRRRRASARCSPTCCAPSARSTASAASASRRRTRRTCGPRRSPRWPRRRPCARSCTTRCRPAPTACSPRCTAATPPTRYLDRLAEARRVVPDLAVSTDIIVGFPGETDDDFARTLEVAADGALRRRLHVHLLAAPGHRGGDDGRPLRRPDVAGERFDRLRVVIERSALAANQARVGRVEEVLVEGPSKKDPSVLAARTPQHRLVHFAPPRRCAPARTRPSRSPAPRRTTSPGASSSSSPSRRTARASRSPRADDGGRAGRRARADGVGQVRRGDGRGAAPSPGPRSSPSTPCRCTAAWTSARPSRRRPTGAPCRHHGIDLVEPTVDFTVADYRRGLRRRRSPASPAARCSSPAPGLYLTAVIDRLELPGRWPGVRAELERRPTDELWRRLAELDPVAAARIEPANRRRVVRALEVTIGSGRPFSSFGPGLQAYPPTDAVLVGLRWPRDVLGGPDRARGSTAMMAGRPARRGRRASAAAGHVADRPPGARLQGAARPPRRATCRSTRPSPRSCCAPGSSPSARSGGSVATRAYAGSTSSATRSPRWRRPWSPRCTHDRTHAHQAPRTRQRLPRAVRRRRRRRRPPGAGAAAVRPHPRRRRRRAARRLAGGRLRRPHGALQRRRQPGRDERQRHPLLRPGRRRTARRPRRPAHPHRRRTAHRRAARRPRTRTRSSAAVDMGEVADARRSPTAGPPSAPTRTAPSPTSASATRTPSSASTTSHAVDLLRARRAGCPHVNLEIVEPGPERHAITMRVHERGAGITEACGTGAAAAAWAAARWGLVDAGVDRTARAHGRRQRESGAPPSRRPAVSR